MKIQLICSSPGMWRNGIQHTASEFYDEGHWNEKQLERFRADPAFVVRTVDETTENTLTDVDFTLRVDAEVSRLVTVKINELQSGFDKAVSEAVTEKLATIKAASDNTIDDLGRKLSAANAKIADLEKQLPAATAPQNDGTGKPAPKK